MLNDLEQFYLDLEEPNRGCFIALRDLILSVDEEVVAMWKYRAPFFYFKGKRICYLWMDKKTKEPYIGIIDGHLINHPSLEKGDRKQIKIMRVDPNEDIDVEAIEEILKEAIEVVTRS